MTAIDKVFFKSFFPVDFLFVSLFHYSRSPVSWEKMKILLKAFWDRPQQTMQIQIRRRRTRRLIRLYIFCQTQGMSRKLALYKY